MARTYTDINSDTDIQRFAAAAPAWTPWPGAAIDWDFVARRYWWGGAEKLEANFTTFNLNGGSFDATRGLLQSDTTDISLSLSGLGSFQPAAMAMAFRNQSAPAATKTWIQFDAGAQAERTNITQTTTLTIPLNVFAANVSQCIVTVAAATTNALDTRHGVAGSFSTNDFKAAANGVDAVADTAGTMSAAPTTFRVRASVASGAPTGWLARVIVFQANKTQAELNALSIALQSGVTPAWTPLDLGSALIAWWSAGDHGTGLMTDDGAGLISSWTDKKGGLAYTGTTTQRPTWGATAAGAAYPGVTADGVGNFLNGAMTGFPSGSAESWVGALIDQTADAVLRPVFHYGTLGANANRQLVKSSSSNRLLVQVQGTPLADTTHTFSGLRFVMGGWSGSTMTGYIDGDPTVPATAAATIATGTTRGRIFADTNTVPTTFGKGALVDLFVCGPITTLQRQQLEGWSLWKVTRAVQLPPGHPYKSAAP